MLFKLLKGIDEGVFDYEVLYNCAFLQVELGFRECLSKTSDFFSNHRKTLIFTAHIYGFFCYMPGFHFDFFSMPVLYK